MWKKNTFYRDIICNRLIFKLSSQKDAFSIVQWWKAKVGQGFVLMIPLQTRKIGSDDWFV